MTKHVPTIDVLRGARTLVANKETWCAIDLARDQYGRTVDPTSDRACRWGVNGALIRVSVAAGLHAFDMGPLWLALSRISRRLYGQSAIVVNDTLGRLASLSIIDAAIAELGEAP